MLKFRTGCRITEDQKSLLFSTWRLKYWLFPVTCAVILVICLINCILVGPYLQESSSKQTSFLPELKIRSQDIEEQPWKVNVSIFDDLPDYCQPTERPVLGLEGFVPNGFELLQTHILITPGERSSSRRITLPNTSSPLICSNIHCKSEDVYRTGSDLNRLMKNLSENQGNDRYFRSNFNKDHPCSREDLSFDGIQHHIKLGHFLKHTYLTDLHLETSLKYPKHIKVFSSASYVTQKSSRSLLYGLLSEELFHHVHNVKVTKLSSHMCSQKKSRHMTKSMLQQEKYDCPVLFKKETEIRQMLAVKIRDDAHFTTADLQHIASNVCSHSNKGCYFQDLSLADLPNLKKLIQKLIQNHENLSKDANFMDFAHVYTYPFLQRLVNAFHYVDYVFEKLFLYFVDDYYLFYLSHVLNLPNINLPRPGSRITIELYKKSNDVFQPYYVRVLFNGADITHFVPLCDIKMEKGLCRLKNFARLLHFHKDLKTAYQDLC